MDDAIVEKIYEAAVIPELWTGVLDDVAHMAGGLGGAFLVPRTGQWTATPGIEEMMSDLMTTGLIRTNERTRRLLALDPTGFARDIDIFNLDDLPNEPVYRDFFIPRGGGFGTATLVTAPSGDTVIVHIERAFSHGLVETNAIARLDAMRPHLARSALLSARLQMTQAANAAEVLNTIGLPACVLDRRGRVLAANRLLDAYVPHVVQDRRSRFTLANRPADRMLGQAVAALNYPLPATSVVRSIPLPASDGVPPLVFHVVPVIRTAHDIFVLAACLILVTPVAAKEVPSTEIVQGLFDLTPAEARIAREIGRGRTVAEVARIARLSEGTVRNQLKAVLAKSGLHRQADLIALLQSASAPRLPDPD